MQQTLDGSPAPEVIHEGASFNSYTGLAGWAKYRALSIIKETEKAFQLQLDSQTLKYIPKSISRIEKVNEGLIIKVPKWFAEKE